MAESAREPSHPPSEPPPSLRSSSAGRPSSAGPGDGADRPVRIQLFVALIVGLVLVATGLYLWRRKSGPEGAAEAASSAASAQAAASATPDGGAPPAMAPTGAASGGAAAGALATGVTLSEPKVLACQDRGPKKTAAQDCDRLQPVEQALTKAIEQSASCVPQTAGGGTIEYVADVSFLKKRVGLALPKGGRSMKNGKAVAACGQAVKRALSTFSVDGIQHAHQRYKISVTATYPGPVASKP